MATYNVGDKVMVPATVSGINVDETGLYLDLKIKANNKIVNLHCEEEDISQSESSETTTDTETTEP